MAESEVQLLEEAQASLSIKKISLLEWARDTKVANVGISDTPALALLQNKIFCIHRGIDGGSDQLWFSVFDGTTWARDTLVSNLGISGGPASLDFRNLIHTFHRGIGGSTEQLWRSISDGKNWYQDTHIANVGITDTPAVAYFDDLLYCMHQGSGGGVNTLWYTTTSDGNSWLQERNVPNVGLTGAPALAVFQNKLYCVHRGLSTDSNTLWYTAFNGSSWSRDTKIANVETTSSPALFDFGGQLYCFHQGSNQYTGSIWYSTFDGENWSPDKMLPGVGITGTPALLILNGQLYCFHQGQGKDDRTLWYTRLSSDVLRNPVNIPFDLLDVWGEGRIHAEITTGFDQAYNLNKFDQKISNGPATGRPIPDLISVKGYGDLAKFPINDEMVMYITLMGAPIDPTPAREMARVLAKNGNARIFLYDPSSSARNTFEQNTKDVLKLDYQVEHTSQLPAPFNQVLMPGSVYVYKRWLIHDEP